jgi:hypothetical protein
MRPRRCSHGEHVPREGLLLASLTASDGLVEHPDTTTTVASGDMLTGYP